MSRQRTVAVVSRKGGTGKTTIAVNMAVCAARAGINAGVVDMDPQGSAVAWSRLRAADGLSAAAPTVAHAIAVNLADVVVEAGELALIDTPANDPDAAMAGCELADVVLVPCRPALSDTISIAQTLTMVERLGGSAKAWVVLSCVPSKRRLSEAFNMLRTLQSAHGVSVALAEVCLRQYVDVARAADEGLGVVEFAPRSKAAQDMRDAWGWLSSALDGVAEGA